MMKNIKLKIPPDVTPGERLICEDILIQMHMQYVRDAMLKVLPEEKIYDWFLTKNPLLGDVTPVSMIRKGRGEKLLKFIETQLDENDP